MYRVALFKPLLSVGVVGLSLFVALLEGIGLSFILPIVELAQGTVDPTEATGVLAGFVFAYQTLGVPFTLGTLVVGVTAIMVVRYTTSFLVSWLTVAIQTYYVRHLQKTAYENALDAKTAYFDREGSDDILNAIVTQAEYAGKVIKYAINTLEYALLAGVYLAVALYLAPLLTVATVVLLGGIVLLFRYSIEAGYSIGDRVADANERIQQAAQAGTQGIRDVKIFGLAQELRATFGTAVDQFTVSQITLVRNETAIKEFYNLATAVTVFVLIYVALTYLSLSLSSLGVFLFAMFKLGPVVSSLNGRIYKLEGQLPHLVRTQAFIDDLQANVEPDPGEREAPSPIETVTFEDVGFAYDADDGQVLEDVSFSVERGEFVAFVGPSGAGKSTIAALLARMYAPETGRIRANGVPIEQFDLREWRSRISVVRQDPHIFDDTLRRNITVGARDASQSEIDRVCEIARVTEFLDDLPAGYETQLGDEGVRLSGGQRQRVALARALLTDADVLVLDEATSDLDSHLEREVQVAIERMDREYSIVAIAHRLSTVKNADRIYTLEKGTVTETGGHTDLIDRDGTYAKLYAIQSETG